MRRLRVAVRAPPRTIALPRNFLARVYRRRIREDRSWVDRHLRCRSLSHAIRQRQSSLGELSHKGFCDLLPLRLAEAPREQLKRREGVPRDDRPCAHIVDIS